MYGVRGGESGWFWHSVFKMLTRWLDIRYAFQESGAG